MSRHKVVGNHCSEASAHRRRSALNDMVKWFSPPLQMKVQHQPGDTIIAVPAKSGTTWTMNIFHQLRTGGDPDFKDNPNDFPQMVVADDYQGTATQCIFDFIWHSRFACPPCKSDQVKIHKSFCDANGVSKWHVTRNEGERCVIGHTPNSWLKTFPDFKKDEF